MIRGSKYDLGMPIDLATPAAHVGDVLDRADHTALSVTDLAEGYSHSISSDLQRVQDKYGLSGDLAAIRWIIEYVAQNLTHVSGVDDGYRLDDGKTFDDLKWNNRSLKRRTPPPRLDRLAKFFDPMTGDAEARSKPDEGLTELRESLRPGWDRLLGGPIVIDNRGVVLAGRRRKKLAAELGLDLPRDAVVKLDLPNNDVGNLERWRVMAHSNTGKPWTAAERKKLLMLLADEDGKLPAGVTQDDLATTLNVSKMQINRDLCNLGYKTADKRGTGRPRKDPAAEPKPTKKSEEIQPQVAAAMDEAEAQGVEPNLTALAKEMKVPRAAVREAAAREEGARAVLKVMTAPSEDGCLHCPNHCP